MHEIETLDSKIVYQNKWMTVREDRIRRPSGAEGIYGVVDKPDFVAILPIEDGHIHIVGQCRYPVKAWSWEIPQGAWESKPDADHSVLAAGELREETGLVAKSLTYVGYTHQANGYSSQGCHVYLATDFERTERQLDEEEEGLVTKCISLVEFERMITSGELKDADTISAYGLAKLKGLV